MAVNYREKSFMEQTLTYSSNVLVSEWMDVAAANSLITITHLSLCLSLSLVSFFGGNVFKFLKVNSALNSYPSINM